MTGTVNSILYIMIIALLSAGSSLAEEVRIEGPASSWIRATLRVEDAKRPGADPVRRLYVRVSLEDQDREVLVRIFAAGRPDLKPRLHDGGGTDWYLLSRSSPGLYLGPWTQRLAPGSEAERTVFVETACPLHLVRPGFLLPMTGFELLREAAQDDAIVQAAGPFIWGEGSDKPVTLVVRRVEFALEGALKEDKRALVLRYTLLLSFLLSTDKAVKALGWREAYEKILDVFCRFLMKDPHNTDLMLHFTSWMAKQGDLEVAYSCLARWHAGGLHQDAFYFSLARLAEALDKPALAGALYKAVPGSSPLYPLAPTKNSGACNGTTLLRPRAYQLKRNPSLPPLLEGNLFPSAYPLTGRRTSHKLLTSLIDASVERGLHWLMRHQEAQGYWDSDSFFTTCDKIRCQGPGGAGNDVGVTGLAVLALLTSPSRYTNPDYREAAWKGVQYLVSIQEKETGQFGPRDCFHFNYSHAMAELCLLEALGRTGNPALVEPARRGLDYIVSAQTKGAGWRYRYPPKGESDTSLTSWMVNDLILGQRLHLGDYHEAIGAALGFFDQMTDPRTGRVGYNTRGSLSARLDEEAMEKWPQNLTESLTAAALECQFLFGKERVQKRKREKLSLALIQACPPAWKPEEGRVDYYFWYYGSQLVPMAGRDFEITWYEALADALMKGQAVEGCCRGSWDPSVDPWGAEGGRIYSTALALMCLVAPERYHWEEIVQD